MRRPTLSIFPLLFALVFSSGAWTQDGDENGISSYETKNHVGEFAMVCGVIVAVRRERQPIERTFLYFDKLPPQHEFFVYIKDEYRKALPVEPESFVDRKACVYGKIVRDNGLRQVIALVRTFQIAVEGIEMDSK